MMWVRVGLPPSDLPFIIVSMNPWAFKRKVFFTVTVFIFLLLIVTIPIFLLVSPAERVDVSAPKNPQVLWSRAVLTSDGIYNAVSRVSSPHSELSSSRAYYRFNFYNSLGEIIASRDGSTSVPSLQKFYVFEDRIYTAETPEFVTFQWLNVPWQAGKSPDTDLFVQNTQKFVEEKSTRLDTSIRNRSFRAVENIEVVALLLDQNGDLVGLSRSFVDRISGETERSVSFTWPKEFVDSISTQISARLRSF